ncbi:MAG: hypothetical protein KDA93_03360 [Planctomycetaceae bacterium]|nr:hypothetical protein [Planctomycetaceae bacterium]
MPFTSLPYAAAGLVAAGRYLVARSGDEHLTFAPNGSQIDSDHGREGLVIAAWSEANQKVYYLKSSGSPRDLRSRNVDENGTTYPGVPQGGLGLDIDSPHHSSHGMTGPVRVSPDGSVVLLGSGFMHDPQTLERQTLSLANSITDAAWLGDTLYTVRDVDGTSEFQRWTGATYDNDQSLEKPGAALALLAVSETRLVGVSLNESGVPVFSVLDENLGDHSIANDAVYVNDNFTQADGTEIADADPNTPGAQFSIVGLNAFPTIQQAIDAVRWDGVTVYVTDDLSSDGPGFYQENLSIRKSVTIFGTEGDPSAVVIDGDSSGRVIFVGPHQVTLQSLTLQNGSANSGGGLFNDGGNVQTEDLVIQNNSVTVSGGGIYAAGAARTTLVNTVVNGNMAGRHGGGIWNSEESTLIVRSGSSVSDNHVSGDATTPGGGGIMNYGGRLALTDASVMRNVANGLRGSGGGIYSTGGELTIDGSTVSGNTAGFAGGGIKFSGGRVHLSNSHLDSNAVGSESTGTGSGGGVHLSGTSSRFSHFGGTMSNNHAGWQGGGVWNQNGTVVIDRQTVIEGNRAAGHAASHGGGIYHGGGRLSINDGVTISQNEADGSGGGIYIDDGSITFRDSFITDNTAKLDGGGVHMLTGNLFLDNVRIDRNTAGTDGATDHGNGGGLHVHGRDGQLALVAMYRGTVSGNSATQNGGGIWNQGPTVTIIRNAWIDGNTASGDEADNGGGGIYNSSGRLAMLNVTISNNVANGAEASGGGVFVVKGGVSIEGNSTVSGNSASRVGGGVEVINGPFWLVDSTLSQNDAERGGGLHVTGTNSGRIDIRNSLVEDNSAELEGGGLWHQSGNVMLVRSGSRVSGNTASGDAADQGGGGIFNNGGRLVLYEATIDSNTANGTAGSGGGLLLTNGTTTIQNSTLSNNTANRAGGGIEIANGRLMALNMSLLDNIAGPAGAANQGDGGGLHVTGTTQVRVGIYGGTISGNTAARNGGGLWHQAGSVLAITQGTTIANNRALGNSGDQGGGGLFNNGGRVAVTEASLWGNMTDGSGGAVLSTSGTVTLDNSTVSGNTAGDAGGGIVSHGNLITANATIADNRANASDTSSGTGGGILNHGLATLKNTIVAGNLVGSGTARSDLAGNIVTGSSRYSLIGDAATAGGMADGVNGNIVGNDGVDFLPLSSILDPLAANGGPTFSHLLVANSPAIDNGLNSAATSVSGVALTHDQRGTGFSRIKNTTVDIGAIEA